MLKDAHTMLILAAAAAAAVAMTAPPESSVRTQEALTPGTIIIAPTTGSGVPVETAQVFDEAVQRAASSAGFTLLPGQDHSRYTAQVTVTRTSRGVVAAGRAASAPPLASLSGSVSLSLPPGGTRFSELIVTTMKVVISRRSDGRAIWSGSAVTARTADARSGSVAMVARTLADAVLSQFPGQAVGPVSIP